MNASRLLTLAQLFQLNLKEFAAGSDVRLIIDLMEIFGEPVFDEHRLTLTETRKLIAIFPAIGKAVLHLYQRYREISDIANTLASWVSSKLLHAAWRLRGLPPRRLTTASGSQKPPKNGVVKKWRAR